MTAVAASESHNRAVMQDEQLHCFGRNDAGHCDVPESLGPVTALAATSEDSETTARHMQRLLDDIPHAPEPTVSADEAFARTAERGILRGASTGLRAGAARAALPRRAEPRGPRPSAGLDRVVGSTSKDTTVCRIPATMWTAS